MASNKKTTQDSNLVRKMRWDHMPPTVSTRLPAATATATAAQRCSQGSGVSGCAGAAGAAEVY
uniref:Uncharacterized protein n=1 Tax=Oryza brachyantha TaxID=4533 RepID=J3L7X1_ORYBR